jgi:hypothetical protein
LAAGSIIHRGGEANLRVVNVIPSDDLEKFDVARRRARVAGGLTPG